jgi:hypothetical protein
MNKLEKEMDMYIPIYFSSTRNNDGYYYVKEGVKISHEKLFQLRNKWINDDNYDCPFNVFLEGYNYED